VEQYDIASINQLRQVVVAGCHLLIVIATAKDLFSTKID